jgi:hypothetical protein
MPRTHQRNGPGPGDHNSGYDDSRGDYVILNHDHVSPLAAALAYIAHLARIVRSTSDITSRAQIAYRFEVVGHLGRGSFGQVRGVVGCFWGW